MALTAFRPMKVAAGTLTLVEIMEGWKNKKAVQSYEEAMRQGHNPFRQQAEGERARRVWERMGGTGAPPDSPVEEIRRFELSVEKLTVLHHALVEEGFKNLAEVETIHFAAREYMLNDEELFLLIAYLESLLRGVTPPESFWWLCRVSEERISAHHKKAA